MGGVRVRASKTPQQLAAQMNRLEIGAQRNRLENGGDFTPESWRRTYGMTRRIYGSPRAVRRGIVRNRDDFNYEYDPRRDEVSNGLNVALGGNG